VHSNRSASDAQPIVRWSWAAAAHDRPCPIDFRYLKWRIPNLLFREDPQSLGDKTRLLCRDDSFHSRLPSVSDYELDRGPARG
jgi:hypothetical protein